MYSKNIPLLLFSLIPFLFFCKSHNINEKAAQQFIPINVSSANYTEVAEINLPDGFTRKEVSPTSFAHWLRRVNLKQDNTVYLFDGRVKPNQQAQFAVLDISVGKQNLQQCADAVMRLRAEYLFSLNKYSEISFIDNEGTIYQFTPPYTPAQLDKYLQKVFGMCGTASLSKQMKAKNIEDMQVGDVLVRGGFPGHAVMVMDMAENNNGEKIYMLAQSYMPAQDIHILKNPANEADNPWYKINADEWIQTPEYSFKRTELKRW